VSIRFFYSFHRFFVWDFHCFLFDPLWMGAILYVAKGQAWLFRISTKISHKKAPEEIHVD